MDFILQKEKKKVWDEQKDKDDKATEESVRKMLKLAGPAIGVTESSVNAKSKEGKAEHAANLKREQQSNLKKNHGNKSFSEKKFLEAIKYYTEAIEIYPENHLLYSNRSMAYFELKQFDLALNDSTKSIELNEDFVKGHFRKKRTLFVRTKQT